MKTMGAAKFKSECLGLMDEVQAKGSGLIITKNGRPVVQVLPISISEAKHPLDAYYIGGEICGDIMAPVVPLEDYEALR